jgi:translation initiation factor eIF-2B subunit delta
MASSAQPPSTSPAAANEPKPPTNQEDKTNNAANANPKLKQQQQKPKTEAPADGSSEKLSPAELKKKAKAEKAARRIKEKAEREAAGGGGGGSSAGAQQQPAQGGPSNAQTPRKGGQAGGKDGFGPPQKGQRYAGGPRPSAPAPAEVKTKEDKNVAVFGHLYGVPRRSTIAGAAKEVHPAVLALGLQIRDYVICGSSARCVATLIAFKRVSRFESREGREKKITDYNIGH